jgi:hypothetical protein
MDLEKIISKIQPFLIPSLLSLGALFICLGNPLHPLATNQPQTDQSAFLLLGQSMHRGIMPYRDLFDHKGPLLYVINWLGLFAGFTGVWLIELAGMLVSVFFCYKTARRFFDEAASFVGTAATFAALPSWYGTGSLCESYALPFSFVSLYCLSGYFVQDYELKRRQVFISGACMGGVLMLRANMIGLWIGLCAAIFIHSLSLKKFRLLPRYVLFFGGGLVVSIAPFMVWMAAARMLDGFYRCYIQFNFTYIEVPPIQILRVIAYAIYSYPVIPLVTAIMLYLFLIRDRLSGSQHLLNLTNIAAFGVTVYLSALSGRSYEHYFMVFLPCLVVPLAWMAEAMASHLKIKPAIALILIGIMLNRSVVTGVNSIRDTMNTDEIGNELASFIKSHTAPDEPILMVGNYCRLYFMSERSPVGYYVNIPAHSSIDASYLEEFAAQKPRVIASYAERFLPKIIGEYIKAHYTPILEYRDYVIWELNDA